MVEILCAFQTLDQLKEYRGVYENLSYKPSFYNSKYSETNSRQNLMDTVQLIDDLYMYLGMRVPFQCCFRKKNGNFDDLDHLVCFNAAIAVYTNFLFLREEKVQSYSRKTDLTIEQYKKTAINRDGCNYLHFLAQKYAQCSRGIQKEIKLLQSFFENNFDYDKNYFKFDKAISKLKGLAENCQTYENNANNKNAAPAARMAFSRAMEAYIEVFDNIKSSVLKMYESNTDNSIVFEFCFELLIHFRALCACNKNINNEDNNVSLQQAVHSFANRCDIPIVFGTEHLDFSLISYDNGIQLLNRFGIFVKNIAYYLYTYFDGNLEMLCCTLKNYCNVKAFDSLKKEFFAFQSNSKENELVVERLYGKSQKERLNLLASVISVFSDSTPYFNERWDINDINTYKSIIRPIKVTITGGTP